MAETFTADLIEPEHVPVPRRVVIPPQKELTGGKVNYYLTHVSHPQREEQPAYTAECEDIIQALNMTFDEGCIFKAIWRSANARLNNGKPGLIQEVYDAQKMVHYAGRILRQATLRKSDDNTSKTKSRGTA